MAQRILRSAATADMLKSPVAFFGFTMRWIFQLMLLSLHLCGVSLALAQDNTIIKAQPALTFLTEQSPPGEYLDKSGQAAGVTVQLIRILQQRLQEPGKIEVMPWARAYQMALTGPNFGLFETSRTAQREALFHWVGPLKILQTKLVGLKSKIKPEWEFKDIVEHLVACGYRGSANAEKLQQLGFKVGQNLLLTTNTGDCHDLLKKGRIDLVTLNDADIAPLNQQLAVLSAELQTIATLGENRLYLAFSAKTPLERVQRWQNALEQSYLDGTMRLIYQGIYSEEAIALLEAEFQTAPRPTP